MKKLANAAPASGPTIDDVAAQARERPPSSVEERRQVIAELYPKLRIRELAELLGCSTGTIASDVRALGISERVGRRRMHPVPKKRQCLNHEDPRCPLHDSGGWFTPQDASQVTRGRAKFCNRLCARRHCSQREAARKAAAERHARADAEVERICRAAGMTTVAALAANLGMAENTLIRHLWDRIEAEKHLIEGEHVWLIPLGEAERFEREDWPTLRARVLEVWEGRPFSSRWNGQARQRWGGRRGGGKSPSPGGNPRGRPRGYTDKQAQQVRKLRGLHNRDGRPPSYAMIARITKLSKWQVEQIVAAEEVSGKPL